MQVHCDEGIANHIGPEPCAGIREAVGEASVGERTGQPSSRDIPLSWVPTPSHWRKATRTDAIAQASFLTRRSLELGMYARSSHGNREISSPTVGASTVQWPASGSEEPKPMMNGLENSDSVRNSRQECLSTVGARVLG